MVQALAKEPTAWRYGYELCKELGIKAGSMYPILMRLADRGQLHTTWETDAEPGRPPRRLYRLTGSGLALAAELDVVKAPARNRAVAGVDPVTSLAWGRP
ncbi:MAG: PadR family transcriptional regulator [Acidimicrobiia bacterium]